MDNITILKKGRWIFIVLFILTFIPLIGSQYAYITILYASPEFTSFKVTTLIGSAGIACGSFMLLRFIGGTISRMTTQISSEVAKETAKVKSLGDRNA